ncbi:hypothetical protein [Streptomyces angustmyceticus]|uniref:hypothetical protein n=1 Tax=Streptomyces angustmyceticus TaxID=285578 RepID=UPI0021AF1E4D|nr:hypothetical protein [Streptomyces angustmyceticus]
MKEASVLIVAVILAAWLVWNLWNLFHMAIGLRNGSWRRAMWWTRLCSVALCAGLALWIRGVFGEGLNVRETCLFVHHERYDAAYWDSHAEEFRKVFPLHNKCNAHYDLVPAWINPAIVTCAVISLAAVAVLLWFGTTHLTRLTGKENQS